LVSQDLDDEGKAGLLFTTFVAVIIIILITVIFSVLIDSQAQIGGYNSLPTIHDSAVFIIIVLGVGVGIPCLGVVILFAWPIWRCFTDFTSGY